MNDEARSPPPFVGRPLQIVDLLYGVVDLLYAGRPLIAAVRSVALGCPRGLGRYDPNINIKPSTIQNLYI